MTLMEFTYLFCQVGNPLFDPKYLSIDTLNRGGISVHSQPLPIISRPPSRPFSNPFCPKCSK